MTDAKFLAAFEAGRLARSAWTHDAHVLVAWLYLNRSPFPEALEKVRTGIQKLNAAYARANAARCAPAKNKPAGYHDTITVAFVRLIAARRTPSEDFHKFRDRNPDLFDRSLSALRVHYTKKLLFSAKARKAFVEPDRKELPTHGLWLAEPKPRPTAKPRRRRNPAPVATSA
jgi:hypothetical protein